MPLTYITVTETFTDGTGAADSNVTVTLTPSQAVYAGGVAVVTPAVPIMARVVGGQLLGPSGGPLQLLANSQPGLTLMTGTGLWWWTAAVTQGGVTDTWSFQLGTALPSVELYATKGTPAGVAGIIGPSNGTDDTAAIQAFLTSARTAGTGVVRGAPGQSYLISAPLRVGSGTTLDMTGCTVTLLASSNCNAVQNWAVAANRRVLDLVASGTTTVTSATAAFTAADATAPNNVIRVYYPDGSWQDTTIAQVTNSTTAILAAAAIRAGTGLCAVIGAGRDSGIRVTGGTWIRNSPNNPASVNAHQLRFRHCDVLEVGPIGGATLDGRYMVSVGDCARFLVHDINPSSTISDTVHVNGPAWSGFIDRVTNPSPGDDLVALTCGELGTYADVMGNISDVAATGVRVPVNPATSPVVVKLLAGQSTTGNPYTLDRITVRDVKSAILSDYPVNIADDPSSGAYTTGGIWGKITVSDIANINPASTYPAVNIIGANVADLEASGLYTVNPASSLMVLQSPGNGHAGSFVARLKTDAARGRIVVNSGSSIRSWYSPLAVETPYSQPAVLYGDGVAIQATAPDNAVLDITGALSMEIWLVPAYPQVAFATPAGKSGQYWIEGNGTPTSLTAAFTIQNGSQFQTGPVALQAGRLNYVAGTYIPSTSVNTYLNGALASANTTGIPATAATTTNPFYLCNRQGFSRYFAGQVADVRVWNGALTAADIALHQSDPGNLYATSATLVARWKCDEGTGTALNDSSGNGINGTLSAASWNPPYTPYLVQPQLSTGAAHTVDDVIAALQRIGLVHQ